MPPEIIPGVPTAASPPFAGLGATNPGAPPGDPLAALFAALLAQNVTQNSTQNVTQNSTQNSSPPPAAPHSERTELAAKEKTAEETTAEETQVGLRPDSLSASPPLLLPILLLMKPQPLLPNAGAVTGSRAMDIAPETAPQRGNADAPDGELPLQTQNVQAANSDAAKGDATAWVSPLTPALSLLAPVLPAPVLPAPVLPAPVLPAPALPAPALPPPAVSGSGPVTPSVPLSAAAPFAGASLDTVLPPTFLTSASPAAPPPVPAVPSAAPLVTVNLAPTNLVTAENTLKTETASAENKSSGKNTGSKTTGTPLLSSAVLPVKTRAEGAEGIAEALGKHAEWRPDTAPDTTDAAQTFLTPTPTTPAETAPRAEPAPLTRADRAEMVRQAAEAVSAMPLPAKPGDAQQMTLNLHPKDWGKLQISVQISAQAAPQSAEGQPAAAAGSESARREATRSVVAHIVADSPQVKAALENGGSELRRALHQSGLHLERMTITVQSADPAAQSGAAAGSGQQGRDFEQSHFEQSSGFGNHFGQAASEPRTDSWMSARLDLGSSQTGAALTGFTGQSMGGQQGHSSAPSAPAYAFAEPEPDTLFIPEPFRRTAPGRLDMHA